MPQWIKPRDCGVGLNEGAMLPALLRSVFSQHGLPERERREVAAIRSASLAEKREIARHLIDVLCSVRPVLATAPAAGVIKGGKKPARVSNPRIRRRPDDTAIKERPILFAPPLVRAILEGRKTVTRRPVIPQPTADVIPNCPFGSAGDYLRVREKWGYRGQFYDRSAPAEPPYVYAADGPPERAKFQPWKPSLHMPRAATRLVLQITSVCMESLREITLEQARQEGCPREQLGDPIRWFQTIWDQYNSAMEWSANPKVWVVTFRGVVD
jgi:hypothetical protein